MFADDSIAGYFLEFYVRFFSELLSEDSFQHWSWGMPLRDFLNLSYTFFLPELLLAFLHQLFLIFLLSSSRNCLQRFFFRIFLYVYRIYCIVVILLRFFTNIVGIIRRVPPKLPTGNRPAILGSPFWNFNPRVIALSYFVQHVEKLSLFYSGAGNDGQPPEG